MQAVGSFKWGLNRVVIGKYYMVDGWCSGAVTCRLTGLLQSPCVFCGMKKVNRSWCNRYLSFSIKNINGRWSRRKHFNILVCHGRWRHSSASTLMQVQENSTDNKPLKGSSITFGGSVITPTPSWSGCSHSEPSISSRKKSFIRCQGFLKG